MLTYDQPNGEVTLNLKITIVLARKKAVSIINQTTGNEKLERLLGHLEKKPDIIYQETFRGFNLSSNPKKISIMVF